MKRGLWKKLRFWVKGSLIYTLLTLLMFFVGRWIFILNAPFSTPPLLGQIFIFPFLWDIYLLGNSSKILIYTIAVVQSLLIGGLIGFLIGKIKKRN